jgi:nucleoside-diphosphate-sugar epimerase
MPEFLVTGGAGFIGSNLVHRLVREGRSVRILDTFATGRRQNLVGLESKIDVRETDLRDAAGVRDAVKGCRFVIHFGALPSVQRSVEDPLTSNEVNITGTLNLLLAARDEKVERFVFSSSSSVYGDTPTLPKHEGMLPQPLSPYALSKLAGEHYCRMFRQLYGLPTYSLRYFNVFGPRQNPKSQYAAVIPLFINALLRREPCTLNGDGKQTRDFTFVDDIVEANLCCTRAPESAAGEAYNVAWGNRASLLELIATLEKIIGVKVPSVHGPARAGDVRDSQADSTLAKKFLGWEPRISFEEGLRRTVAWLREHPDS